MATGVSADGGDLSPAAQRVVEAADDPFFGQGATATTAREITSAHGLKPGALSNHFRSKDDLVFRLVMRCHLLFAATLDDALAAASADPEARLEALVRLRAGVHLRPAARQRSRVANRDYRGVFSTCGGSDRVSLVVTASTILDMCVYAAERVREDGPLSIEELEDRNVAMALRLAGAGS